MSSIASGQKDAPDAVAPATDGTSTTTRPDSPITFPVTPVPDAGSTGNVIRTAAALIIGDEVLNGKTKDTNSHYVAKFCFDLGIELKRIEVIADDESEIIEASRRMVKNYDFVVTSGGIGPTHDDITYSSLAKTFSKPLEYHDETIRRMDAMIQRAHKSQTEEQQIARKRMALFPAESEILYVEESLWVPVVRLEGKLCILPGIPSLFERLLVGLKPYLALPDESSKSSRHQIFTTLPESTIAPFLTALQERVAPEGIRIGSYPAFRSGVTVSLIGRNAERLKEIGQEVAKELQGKVLDAE
ncbi:hypothetical protein BOTBODRAFT_178956 [Botryobasidium botryosum FD-172 SS1]|uniref:MoaB/Mog domain-containing protein n=1 Tax=Botryobasidium botryosum (strain FD-172 SS1) TaxID=930990 RepID=A0A067MDA4_BOTB1|nr:hypothetical protein BOTBODRAFT_178956 [Botryobasidium botryosum FD-172 SS1]